MCCSEKLQADGEGGGVAVVCRRGGQHKPIAAVQENAIMPVSRAARPPFGIGWSRIHTVRDVIVEIQLRCEIEAPARRWIGAYLEMNVHGPSRGTNLDRS